MNKVEQSASSPACSSLCKTGRVLLHDGQSGSYEVQLRLTRDVLTIQKLNVVCKGATSSERMVILRRQRDGGFGLSVKGGAEHNVPVVVSKIFKDQAVNQTGVLFVGDAILQVNGINVTTCTHDEVVRILQNASEEVTLTVRYLQEAPSFLNLPSLDDGGSPEPSSEPGSEPSSPLFDSGLNLNLNMNGSCSHSGASPPASPEAHQLRWQKRWCDARSLPLLMARVSCYAPGTHHQRPNALEVIAVDGVSSGVLQSPNPALCAEWFRAIADNISDLIAHNMRMVNKYAPAHDQIVHMGWVHERLPEPEAWISYRNRFLALRGDHVMIFSCPPVSTRDWGKAESGYLVYEVFCRPLKAAELHEERAFSFSLLIGPGRSRRFAVEHASEMSMWEKAFQMAGFLEVQRIGCVMYRCSYKGQALTLKIDFSHGFTCFDFNTKLPLWSFKFGQLRGSSDDGIARVRFLFLNTETKIVERKELEFANYIAVLHCVHAFVAARVSLVDPGFVESRRGQHKAGCSKAEACG